MIVDGGPAWDVERALDAAAAKGAEAMIADTRRALAASLAAAPAEWFGYRLTVLWTLYMASRETDPQKMAVWLGEMAFALSDIPHDIVGHSIDLAVRTSPHSFMPVPAEIIRIAEPLCQARARDIERLGQMEAALDDPEASRLRQVRRVAHAAHLRLVGGRPQ